MIVFLSLIAWAQPEPRTVRTIDGPSEQVPPALYPGAFRAPPVMQWGRPLPGPKVNAASHAERSRPVIVGEHAYLGTAGSRELFVISRRDGSVVQTFPAEGAVEAEPVLDATRVWFTDTTGATWCYTLEGELVWKHQGAAPLPTRPTEVGDLLVLRDVDDLVYALDRNSGEQAWQYRRKKDLERKSELTLYAAPAPVSAGSVLLLGFSDGVVVALDKDGGDRLWEATVGEGQYPDIVGPVAARGGLVYASGYTGPLVALEAEDATVRWRFDAGSASAPIFHELPDETLALLHPGTDGVLRAFDAQDGNLLWSWNSGRGGALTSPVSTEAGLILGSGLGVLALVDPDVGETLWTWREDFKLQGVAAPPVVEGRQMLVVSNSGRIYAMLSPQESTVAPHKQRPTSRFRLANPSSKSWGRDR
ncbi:MAG: hypothetical protein EA397_05180 [Deltaproteobacteria bacterium]|nr:MAG: hypothetical protein EA397_05180 [Deltaproteobacteria bacterium]